MTSEPRTTPIRVPDRLFAELAAGGGSAQAVAFLERGERARRLLLLRTLLDRMAELSTPLTPVADAWEVVKDAAGRDPEAVDGLLLAPTTGPGSPICCAGCTAPRPGRRCGPRPDG